MNMPSLEDIASRWTPAHTIATVAWAVALVLGILSFVQPADSTYPVTESRKLYAGENATFTYPENWTLSGCKPGEPFIALPGSIASQYKDKRNYPLTIYGTTSYTCVKDRPVRFDISSETIAASDNPCSIRSSTPGERLQNGLYLQLHEDGEDVLAVNIRQNKCFTHTDASVLGFSFSDATLEQDDIATFGMPRVKKADFLASQQYKDIRAVAESIRY